MELSFPTFRSLSQGRWPFRFGLPRRTTVAQQRGLMRVIATAIEDRIPLLPLLEAWAEDEHGIQQRRIYRLIRLHSSGIPLADAAEQVPGVLRDEDILALRFDSQSGTVAAATREVLADSANVDIDGAARLRSTKLYLWTVLILGLPVVIFIEIRILPMFRQIYSEFQLSLPQITERFVQFIQLFENYAWLILLVLLVGVLSLFFARPGRVMRQEITRLVRPLRERQTAGVLRMIAIASAAGRPLPGTLSTLARYHFDPTLRNKLLFVRNEVEQGVDLWQSMNSAGILTEADARALDLSERLGNRSWVLNQLAAAKSRHTIRWMDSISQLALPAIVLLMGLFVLFQTVALMAPLTHLIRSLAM